MTIKARHLQPGDYVNYQGKAREVIDTDGHAATLRTLAGGVIETVYLGSKMVEVF